MNPVSAFDSRKPFQAFHRSASPPRRRTRCPIRLRERTIDRAPRIVAFTGSVRADPTTAEFPRWECRRYVVLTTATTFVRRMGRQARLRAARLPGSSHIREHPARTWRCARCCSAAPRASISRGEGADVQRASIGQSPSSRRGRFLPTRSPTLHSARSGSCDRMQA